jgi:outer membrane protein
MLRTGMRAPENLLKIAALWVVAASAWAQGDEPGPAAAPASGTGAPVEAAASAWRLGAAVGYGRRSNPLIQSEDIPVVVDLDIAWFGKRWFFDNGDVGFELIDRSRFTTSLVARLNSDRVFFGKTNTRYVNLAYAGRGDFAPLVNPETGAILQQQVEVKPRDRDYAVELGLETLIDGDWGVATLRAFHDVSGTHRGYELSADYSWRWITGRLSLAPVLGVSYKSGQLNDYYWGVHRDEVSLALPEYHARGGFGAEVGIRAVYFISRHLRVAVSMNYERLSDEVAASPLAQDDYVTGYFSGLAWTF